MQHPAVLVTRPEPGGSETAAHVAALGWEPVLAPALVLESRDFVIPRCQALLLTSRAAARALPPPVPGLPVVAVGEATAVEARARGWADCRAADGTAESLVALIAATLDPGAGPLLLAVGQGYSLHVAAALRALGFRVIRRIAYAAAPAGHLPEPARQALSAGRVGGVLFHSPRSALCAMTLIRAAGLADVAPRMEVFAISRRVAQAAVSAAAPFVWRAVHVAARPDEQAMLALLGRPRDAGPPGSSSRSGEP
jgi:uroporphyrinogen-III synthase